MRLAGCAVLLVLCAWPVMAAPPVVVPSFGHARVTVPPGHRVA